MGTTSGFKVRVGVVLPHEGKILLVRQNGKPFWIFPGGTLEPKEGLKECAIREMKEETGLTVSIEKLLYVADFFPSPGSHVIDIFFLARWVSGTLTETMTENIDALEFFPLAEVTQLQVEPKEAVSWVLADIVQNFDFMKGQYIGKYGQAAEDMLGLSKS